jgi:ceramide glucosyltransferase
MLVPISVLILVLFLLVLLLGAWAYCGLSVLAAVTYLRQPSAADSASNEPISVLKPLAGLDEGLEENLRTFFEQDYSAFELVFAVREISDPCIEVVERLRAQHPAIPSRLIITGEPPYPHAKVYSLSRMLMEARHDLVVMSDSDIRVGRDFLTTISSEFAAGEIALATCPYCAVAGASVWSKVEALGMNTSFWQGVLTARMIDGMKFAVGPTIVARKKALDAVGGIDSVRNYLAEDFELGRAVANSGGRVVLSSYVIEHRIGSEPLGKNFAHRNRWVRTSRRSRPWGYIGQIFTFPVPVAALLCAIMPAWWPLLIMTLVIRYASAWMTAHVVLGAPLNFLLLPCEDALGFAFWIAGFFGSTIAWRGRVYRIDRRGRAVGLAE